MEFDSFQRSKPWDKWYRLLQRSNRLQHKVLLRPRYCRSVWGVYSFPEIEVRRKSWRRWLFFSALVSCCSLSPSTTEAVQMNHRRSLFDCSGDFTLLVCVELLCVDSRGLGLSFDPIRPTEIGQSIILL